MKRPIIIGVSTRRIPIDHTNATIRLGCDVAVVDLPKEASTDVEVFRNTLYYRVVPA